MSSAQWLTRAGEFPLSAKALRVLHVSDTHSDLEKIAQLKDQVPSESVDLVLLSGDIANMPMCKDLSDEDVARYQKDAGEVVKALEDIQSPVLYIPGNHDPMSLFSCASSPTFGSSSVNVHKRCVRLAPNLLLMSFGGSIPGYLNGEKFWNGFPYNTDAEFEADLSPFLDVMQVEPPQSDDVHCLRENDSVLLMTHVGPNGSDTALDRSKPASPIVGGSSFLGETLKTTCIQRHVFLNIHGHIHAGFGRSQLGCVDIINPGSLHEGRYSLLTLSQNETSKRWFVSSLAQHCLCPH